MTQTALWGNKRADDPVVPRRGAIGLMTLIAGSLPSNSLSRAPPAGVQPRLIQGIRSGDGVGDLFNYLFIKDIKSNRIRIAQ